MSITTSARSPRTSTATTRARADGVDFQVASAAASGESKPGTCVGTSAYCSDHARAASEAGGTDRRAARSADRCTARAPRDGYARRAHRRRLPRGRLRTGPGSPRSFRQLPEELRPSSAPERRSVPPRRRDGRMAARAHNARPAPARVPSVQRRTPCTPSGRSGCVSGGVLPSYHPRSKPALSNAAPTARFQRSAS